MRKFLLPLVGISILAIAAAKFVPSQNKDAYKIEHLFYAQGSYIFVKPPLQIASGAVSRAMSSYDSRFIAYLNDPIANQDASYVPASLNSRQEFDPGVRRSAYIYDTRSGQTTQVLNLEGSNIKPTEFQWLPFSPFLYIEYQKDGRLNSCLYNSLTQTKSFLPASSNIEFNEGIQFIATSNEILRTADWIEDEEPIGAILHFTNIQSGATRQLKVKDYISYDFISDGKKLFVGNRYGRRTAIRTSEESSVPPREDSQRYYEVNINSGELTAAEPNFDMGFDTYLVFCDGSACTITGEYMEHTGEPKYAEYETTLSAEGLEGGASFDRQFAYFTTRSGLFIARFQIFNESQLYQTFAPAIKAKVMSNAKQVGTAVMIYCADYDDMYPLSNDFKNSVMPYVKNESVFAGFQYLMNGQSATSIDDVSNTPMGMIQTPFGTAIVRADTSVIWRDINEPLPEIHF